MPFSEGLSCVWRCAGHQNPVSLFSGPHAPSWEWPAKSRQEQTRTGAGGAKAVREGFQEEVISASGVEGSRSVREGCPRVWGVTAGSMWLEPKRRRQEVVRAGVVESPGVSPCRALTAIITLDSTLRAVGNQDIFCGWNGVTGHPENVTAEGSKIMGSKLNCTFS